MSADLPSGAPSGGMGLSGTSGALSAPELLQRLEKLGCTGTLVAGPSHGPLLALLVEGQPRFRVKLSPEAADARDQPFFFQPHEASALPQLQSRYPESALFELRALPSLGARLELSAAVLELHPLVHHLAEEGFHGCLALSTTEARGVIMLLDGKMAVAVYESAVHRRRQQAALRAIQRLSATSREARLELLPQPYPVMAALLGFAFDQRLNHSQADFSGLEMSDTDLSYYQGGRAYLRLAVPPLGNPGRYGLCRSFPALSLPSEIPGWESQHYRLTLRGRDALNPMTELSMQFRGAYGRSGRQILEGLTGQASVEEAAEQLGLELSEIKPWVERLEREGLIREAELDRRAPDVSL